MVMRIGGLASGMDIDSIVEKLMSAEKAPLNKLYQQKQTYEWQRESYRDVNKQLKAFDSFIFDNMQLQSTLMKQSATSTNSSVSATVTTAKDGATLTIDKVESLATAGRRVGTVKQTDNTTANNNTTMAQLGITGNQTVSMKVYEGNGKFKDVNIDVKSTDKVSDILEKLNNNTGMSAFFDEKSGQMSLTANATGSGTLTYTDVVSGTTITTPNAESLYTTADTGGVLQALGFGDRPDLSHGGGENTPANAGNVDGENAVAIVNGIRIERDSNTFMVNGFNVTLDNTYEGTKPITITSKTDVDNMVDKIKKFVETYNGLVDSLTGKTKETKYRDYTPLTDEQKVDMDEKEIEKWEEKAKSGLLRNDPLIRSGLSELRGLMYQKGGSSNSMLDTLHEMGITTTSSYLDGGKLEINEDKLRAAISKDPQAVADTFTKSVAKGESGEEGIVQKLRSSLSKTMLNIEKKAGKTTMTEHNYSIGKNLLNVDDRITSWKSKLVGIEERYWKQFTAMETAINKANQQSSLFTPGQ